MILKSSQVTFEGTLCHSCPTVVQTFFDSNMTAVLQITTSESKIGEAVNHDKDFRLYRFELGDKSSYSTAPVVSVIEKEADYISLNSKLLKSLTPEHAKILLSADPAHKWAVDPEAQLLSFAGLDNVINSVFFAVCRVDSQFECEKIRSVRNEFEGLESNFDKIKSNKTHLILTFSNHAICIPLDESLPISKFTFSKDISKVAFYENNWYGICNDSILCRLRENQGKLTLEWEYGTKTEDLTYVQLITSGTYLVAKYESKDIGGFHIYSIEDKDFFVDEANEPSKKKESSNITDLNLFPHDLKMSEMPNRYYEFRGKFMFATDHDLSMIVMPPTMTPPAGKNMGMHLLSRLNRTNSLGGGRILISLPLQEGENSFALISEAEPQDKKLSDSKKQLVINEVRIGNAFVDLNNLNKEELLASKSFNFDAYYYDYPNFKKVKYQLEFIEFKSRPQPWLLWSLGGFLLVLLLLVIVFCVKMKMAIKSARKRDSFKPEDCSLMEPVLGLASPLKLNPDAALDGST